MQLLTNTIHRGIHQSNRKETETVPLSPDICATPQTLFWSNFYKGHVKIPHTSWSTGCSPRLLKGAKSSPLSHLLPETLCRNVGHHCLAELQIISSFTMAQIHKIPVQIKNCHVLLCPFMSKPRALQGDQSRDSSARKHFQGTLKACLLSDGSPSSRIKWKIGNLAEHQAHTPRPGWWSQTHPLLPQKQLHLGASPPELFREKFIIKLLYDTPNLFLPSQPNLLSVKSFLTPSKQSC